MKKRTHAKRRSGICRVAIVGTGTIGASWAAFYASKGLSVRMHCGDPALGRKRMAMVKAHLRGMAQHGLISRSGVPRALKRIVVCTDFADAVGGAELVQESVVDSYVAKRRVFKAMDKAAPSGAILASSSSGLLMSRIQKAVRIPGRCLIAHPFNPPHLMPLVEIVPGRATARATVLRAQRFFEGLGKLPVVLNKEVPGHIANRLQAAIWREATDLVLKGVASVEDIDKALYAGPGPRWAFMGQHLIFHLGGGDRGYRWFIEHLHPTFASCWKSMASWKALPKGADARLVRGVATMLRGRSTAELRRWRDGNVARILQAIESPGSSRAAVRRSRG